MSMNIYIIVNKYKNKLRILKFSHRILAAIVVYYGQYQRRLVFGFVLAVTSHPWPHATHNHAHHKYNAHNGALVTNSN